MSTTKRKRSSLEKLDNGLQVSPSILEALIEEGYVSKNGRLKKKGRRLLEDDNYWDYSRNCRDDDEGDHITTAEEAINLGSSMGEQIARRPVRSLFVIAIGLFF
jgi:hypothetical protein